MAGTLSDSGENYTATLLNDYTTFYLALYTANPNFETGAGGTEASGGSYARPEVAMTAPTGSQLTNSGTITFTVGTNIAAGTYTGAALFDAESSGLMVCGDTFGSSITLTNTGDAISFGVGTIALTLS